MHKQIMNIFPKVLFRTIDVSEDSLDCHFIADYESILHSISVNDQRIYTIIIVVSDKSACLTKINLHLDRSIEVIDWKAHLVSVIFTKPNDLIFKFSHPFGHTILNIRLREAYDWPCFYIQNRARVQNMHIHVGFFIFDRDVRVVL